MRFFCFRIEKLFPPCCSNGNEDEFRFIDCLLQKAEGGAVGAVSKINGRRGLADTEERRERKKEKNSAREMETPLLYSSASFLSLSAHRRRRGELPDVQLRLEHVLVEGAPRGGRTRSVRRRGERAAVSGKGARAVVVVAAAASRRRRRRGSKGAPAPAPQDRAVVGHRGRGVDDSPKDRPVGQRAERPRVPGRG